ncbi:LuxR C-terminal-related transcriptional regulator [Aliiglaciecola sp. CAU 1673]|uniref:LuxR C-terminal-related transcriptional regulator n=1 Tax=Aliiglaciecola sp. CAU 1673 TaxID=3032595 RepID=UPI0023DBBC16|nr:LuxR C-terminal-related transcriptional regulator [Aliiglaciecola sp. CAU 1673]MDF2177871.1 LuxR C-terminal-related transcriptional regulator [Aliiglaciecola sp. CAU 1673]
MELSVGVVSELIGQIYQAGLDGKWSGVIDQLRDITQSNKALFFLQKLDEPQPLGFEFRTNFSHCPQALAEYQRRTLEDPYLQVSQQIVEGEAININEHLDVSSLVDSEYYQRILLPLKSHYVMGGCLVRDGIYESIYAINRGPDDPAYSASDFELIKIVTPHLSRAVQIYKDLTLYKRYSSISKSILDQSDKGVLVCDAQGRILIANAFANQELEGREDIQVTNGSLRLWPSAYNLRLHQCLTLCVNQPHATGVQEPILLERPDGETLLVSIAPLDRSAGLVDIDQPCCLVTLTKQNAVRWPTLMKEYGLTPKELALIQAINRKKKLQQLTLEMGVTYNTLATHLKAIYKKMGIHSQAELMVTLGLFRS